MWKVCLFCSQNNKIAWLSNMADTFGWDIHEVRKGIWLVFLDCPFQVLIGWAGNLNHVVSFLRVFSLTSLMCCSTNFLSWCTLWIWPVSLFFVTKPNRVRLIIFFIFIFLFFYQMSVTLLHYQQKPWHLSTLGLIHQPMAAINLNIHIEPPFLRLYLMKSDGFD